jgi:hypothetical protein
MKCKSCGKPAEQFKRCNKCRTLQNANRAKARKLRIASGICPACGTECAPYVRCAKHRKYRSDLRRKLTIRKKASGVCIRCQTPCYPYTMCKLHRDRTSTWHYNRRGKFGVRRAEAKATHARITVQRMQMELGSQWGEAEKFVKANLSVFNEPIDTALWRSRPFYPKEDFACETGDQL